MIDPFSDEAEPLRLDGSRAPSPEHSAAAPLAHLQMGRRPVLVALAVLSSTTLVSGCARPPVPACPSRSGDAHHCQHRFCRYYRGEA